MSSSMNLDQQSNQQQGEKTQPNRNDVLFGRENGARDHPGNKKFRSLVREYKLEFVAASFSRRSGDIPLTIYQQIKSLDPPGRFLKKDQTTHEWFEIQEREALKTISQVLQTALNFVSVPAVWGQHPDPVAQPALPLMDDGQDDVVSRSTPIELTASGHAPPDLSSLTVSTFPVQQHHQQIGGNGTYAHGLPQVYIDGLEEIRQAQEYHDISAAELDDIRNVLRTPPPLNFTDSDVEQME